MKNNKLSTLILSLVWGSTILVASEQPSNPVRAQFEKNMYARSGDLLNKTEYEKVITPFLNEAEAELKCVQFCEQNQTCKACQKYFSTLLDHNVSCFTDYAQNNRNSGFFLAASNIQLKNSIQDLAKQGALQPTEVETELQKTQQLFLEGNKEFYSKLPWSVKFMLWCSK